MNNRTNLSMLAAGVAFAGCTALAGLDGNYSVGDAAVGGSGATQPTGPGSGGTTATGGGSPATGASGPGGAGGGVAGRGGVGGTAGGGGMPPISNRQVSCNDQPCPVGQVCCATANPNNVDNTQIGCAPEGGCAGGEFEIKCNGPQDCTGNQICCGRWPNGYYTDVECTTAMDCQLMNDDYVFCVDNNGPSNTYCVNGGDCNSSGDLPGYFYCG